MRIQVLKHSPMDLEMRMTGIHLGFASALRRIMIVQVDTLAIDKVTIYKNTSDLLTDEFIAHRIGLVPINSEQMEYFHDQEACECNKQGCDKCNVVFELNVDNVSDKIKLVTTDDFKTTHPHSGIASTESEEEQSLFFTVHGKRLSTAIPLFKLQPKSSVWLQAVALRGCGQRHAKWIPTTVSCCKPVPKITIKQKKANRLTKQGRERFVQTCEKKVYEISLNKIVIAQPSQCDFCNACVEWKPQVKDIEDLEDSEQDLSRVKVEASSHDFILTIESAGSMRASTIFLAALAFLHKEIQELEQELLS